MIERLIYSNEFGFIDYSYYKNILILHGAFVDVKNRRQGIFTEMLYNLFLQYPKGTKVQAAIKNKHLIHMFRRLEFIEVKEIEYWGSPSECILFEGII